ncbi:hypothetical protein SRHO_G00296620 [Serrasalmus rhombeus]
MLARVAKPWIIVPVQLTQPRPPAEPALARTSDSHTTTVSIPVAKSLRYSNNKPVLGSDLDTVPVAGTLEATSQGCLWHYPIISQQKPAGPPKPAPAVMKALPWRSALSL